MITFSNNGRAGGPAPRAASPPGRNRLAVLRHVPVFLRLAWRTHRGYAAGVVALRLARAMVPVMTLWVGKLIIDEVVAVATHAGADLAALWRYVGLEIAIVIAGDVIARGSTLFESLLGDLFSMNMGIRIMEHAGTLDLEQFEDPRFYNQLTRAQQQAAGRRISLLPQILGIGQDLVTLLAFGTAVLSHDVWLGLLLVAAILPSFLGETHFASLEYSLLFQHTPERRQLNYLRTLATNDRTIKEVQLFGLASWLIRRYRALAERFYQENRRLSLRRTVAATVLSAIGTGGYYAGYALIILAVIRGAISVGQLTFLAGSLARFRDVGQRLLLGAGEVCEQGLYLNDLFHFFDLRPRVISRAGARAIPTPIRRGFAFEDVGFRYPGSERWAVRHLSLHIDPDECIALVGENGAGKTTLIKLLTRLYDPTEGRITLDGVDLREYDLQRLRHAFGVVLQDFVRYDMRFDENIGIGDIERTQAYLEAAAHLTPHARPTDGASAPPAIRHAADESLASTLLPRLPGRYRQMLGRIFDGGVDLSGGEWQKIAIARAYMRLHDARVLILDEPTAALDARAESHTFERFRDLTRGRIAILISHRFSTVRMADRIVVLQTGRIVESGPHDELLLNHGLYAELFDMQAAGYR